MAALAEQHMRQRGRRHPMQARAWRGRRLTRLRTDLRRGGKLAEVRRIKGKPCRTSAITQGPTHLMSAASIAC